MDLESAFQKHGVWIEEFCTAIFNREGVDANFYEKDNCCELGKWLYGDGKAQHGNLNAYANLVSGHTAFHKIAGKIAHAINEKNYAQAEELLNKEGEYATASHAVRAAIAKLKAEAHS